jgi:hypothetical protein
MPSRKFGHDIQSNPKCHTVAEVSLFGHFLVKAATKGEKKVTVTLDW